jgi:hypothetical protein
MKRGLLSAAVLATASLMTGTALAAGVSCEYTNNGFMCEAWPQAPGYTYIWNTEGNLSLPDPGHPNSPFRNVGCFGGPGKVFVTVVFPGGGSETAYRNLMCAGGGWPYSPH